MIALSTRRTHLRSFGSTALFESPMILLNRPTKLSPLQALKFAQALVIGRPVINVTVWGDNLEDFDETISFEMYSGSA
jgi:hypothetical protein